MDPERDPGECPHCSEALECCGDPVGLRPYWACPSCPVSLATVLPPRNLGHATALVMGRIHDPIRPDDYPDADGYAPGEQFDADAADPARFVDRVCERLQTVSKSVREQERERRLEDAGRDSPSTQRQADLTGWSA